MRLRSSDKGVGGTSFERGLVCAAAVLVPADCADCADSADSADSAGAGFGADAGAAPLPGGGIFVRFFMLCIPVCAAAVKRRGLVVAFSRRFEIRKISHAHGDVRLPQCASIW